MSSDDETKIMLPRKASSWLAGVVAASLLPTGGAGVLAKYVSSVSDKLDAVISRLDHLEGAGTQARVDDHERRLRAAEEAIAELKVMVVQPRGGR